jgi:type III secretion protein U
MSSEKTEKPTLKKIQDARKKGQVAKSLELPIGCQLAVLLIYITSQGGNINNDIIQLIHLTMSCLLLPIEQGIQIFIQGFIKLMFKSVFLIGAILIAITIISFIVQTGFLIATESMGFKADKLNVVNNLKQMFSAKNLVEFLKSLIKITIISCVFSYLLYHYGGSMQYLPTLSLSDSMNVIYKMIYWLWGALVICYLLFFMADFAFQKQQIMKQLMMSKEEIKQEFKNAEGNQEIKGHRRAMHQEIQSGSLAANVKKSSVIVRNPTHVAIGIHYQKDVTSLPKVTVKGVDEMAKWIVELAIREGVPVIEDVRLARALLNEVDEGHYIPVSLFEPVAELLWLINEMRNEVV